mgnify:CR=1 FL=1
MLKNGLLTLLFAFIPGAGQMYQGYMKRGLSLMLMCCAICVLAVLFAPIALFLMLVFMYSFFDTLNLRAQIALGNAPADDYLVHLDPKDKRLARLLLDSHKLVGWALIAFGALVGYQNILMNTLGDLLWRWGKESPIFRALYLVMDQLPEVLVCVVLIVCGIWLVKGPRTAKKSAPKTEPAEEDFTEYQPAPKKVNVQAILNSINRRSAEDDEAAAGETETGDTTEGDDGIE